MRAKPTDAADPQDPNVPARDDAAQETPQERIDALIAVIEEAPLAILLADAKGTVDYVNPAAARAVGLPAAEICERRPHFLQVAAADPEERTALWARLQQGEPWRGTLHHRRHDGREMWGEATVLPIRDAGGQIRRYAAIAEDITWRKATEVRLSFLDHYDDLTGLPNHRLIGKQWRQIVAAGTAGPTGKVGVLLLDVDNLGIVNDALGHRGGEALVAGLADALRDGLREGDILGRRRGDEFLVVLAGLGDAQAIDRWAARMLERLAQPLVVHGREVAISLSIGASLYPDDGTDFDHLCDKAETAMHQAVAAGRGTWRRFAAPMVSRASDHLSIRAALRRALARDELTLHFQPQLELASGRIGAVEALIRWNHPEMGLLPPARFIPVAEESGMIVEIGGWVLDQACRQAATWRKDGLEMAVAVNLSAVQLARGDLLQTVSDCLRRWDLDARQLELELTESVLLTEGGQAAATLQGLKAMGVRLSIDDFGTGYSSLSYLKRLAVDKLKIDRSFVADLLNNPNDAAIVHAVVQMARGLGLRTLAEGVESAAVLDCLHSHGCDEVQGFHVARPMQADALSGFLAGR